MKKSQSIEDLRVEIQGQIAKMADLLGMMAKDRPDPIVDETRETFLRLSILVGRALDIPLQ
jgi:hypothetical protein